MSVVTTNSTQISNRDSVPSVLSNSAQTRADVKRALAVVSAVNGDSIGSVYKFLSLPSNAVVSSLKISNVDVGASADIGLYDTTANGGAVVSQHFFVAAQSLDSVETMVQLYLSASGIPTVATAEQALWQLLGLSSDPRKMYDVCATLTAAADISGQILLEAAYAE